MAVAIAWLLILATHAFAQSAIAGTVKDNTGAALPGVIVEVASQALIEKGKITATDDVGQYRLVDLRPGTYKLTFSLAGFKTVVRDDIFLESHFTAPVNVEMSVGPVAEVVTVRGNSPVVDVQTPQRREIVTAEMIDALPTGRNYQLMAATVPSVTTGAFDVGGSTTMWTGGALLAHGSLANDSRTLIDGMIADCLSPSGQNSCQYDNEAQTAEIAVQVTGGMAENQLSGVIVNRVPRVGGNAFHGEGIVLFANGALQSTNFDDALRARGLDSGARLYRAYDFNYGLGGPIVRDRLWFFVSGRNNAYNNYVAGVSNPDGTRALDDNAVKAFPARLTGQLTPANRLTAMFDWADKVRGHRKLAANVSPDASVQQSQPAEHIAQAKWTSTLSRHLILDAGFTQQFNGDHFDYEPGVVRATCTVASAFCPPGTGYGSIAHQDTLLSTQSVAAVPAAASGTGPSTVPALSNFWTATASYVSGAHLLKLGIQDRWGYVKDIRTSINGDIVQQYRNGTPFSVLVLNTPMMNAADVNADLGVFVQDTWTSRRLTLSPGVRWDHFNSSIPANDLPSGRFVPSRHFDAVSSLPNWNNVSPRVGVAYDVTGKGRTAVKASAGLYVESQGSLFARTYDPAVFATDARTWTDRNHDDLAQEDEIGPPGNVTFGIRRNQNPAPGIGRPYQALWNVGIEHELTQGLAVSVSYNERRFYNMIWTQNLAVPFSAYTLVKIPDPRDNGRTLPLYNVNPLVFALVNEVDSNSSRNSRAYKGIDTSFTWRLPRGAMLSGGTSTGRTLTRTCDVEDPNKLWLCDYYQFDVPFQTLFKLSGIVPLRYGVRLSGTFQHAPGTERIVTYDVTRAQVPALVATTVSIRVNEPGTFFNDTVNQLDFTASRSFRRGSLEARPALSLFNALNANPVLTQINTYGPALGNAVTVLPPRMARLGLTIRF